MSDIEVDGLTTGVELGGLVMCGRHRSWSQVAKSIGEMDDDTLRRLLLAAVGVLGSDRVVELWALTEGEAA